MSETEKTLIVHAGLHKTGTSHLQNLFYCNNSELIEKCRVYFPVVGIRDLSYLNPDAISGHDGLIAAARLRARQPFEVIRSESKGSSVIFLSAENCLHPFQKKTSIERNFQCLMHYFPSDMRKIVLLTIKDPVAMFRSLYKEFVCGGNMLYRKDIGGFIDDMSTYGQKLRNTLCFLEELGCEIRVVFVDDDIVGSVATQVLEPIISSPCANTVREMSKGRSYASKTDLETAICLRVNCHVGWRRDNRRLSRELLAESKEWEIGLINQFIDKSRAMELRAIIAEGLSGRGRLPNWHREFISMGSLDSMSQRRIDDWIISHRAGFQRSRMNFDYLIRKTLFPLACQITGKLPLNQPIDRARHKLLALAGY